MNGITPLQYSNAPIQMMSALASDIQQQNILNQKRYQEEFNQGLELARMISPEVLNKSFDAQVVNAGIADVKNNLREYIKKNPNANSAQIQSEVQKQLGGISDWSTKVKTIKSNLEETFKQIPQDKKVNKDRWMNAALTKALYKTNPDGTRTFRNAQELDPAFDYATEVWNMGGEAFVDLGGVSKELDDRIKNAAKNKQNVTVTVGATKNKPGFTRTDNIEVPVWAEWDATKNKVTVKKQNGVIDNDVYTAFVGGPNTEYDKFLNIKTRSAFASGENLGVDVTEVFDDKGNIKDQTKFDLAKRNWLTNYLEKFAPVTQTERDVTQPARMDVVVNTGAPKGDDTVMIDVVNNIKSYIKNNPRKKGMNFYPTVAFDNASQDVIIGQARKKTGINTIGLADVQVEERGGIPYVVSSKDIMDPNDPTKVLYKAGQALSPIDVQSNISANKALGTKAVKAAAGKKRNGASEL